MPYYRELIVNDFTHGGRASRLNSNRTEYLGIRDAVVIDTYRNRPHPNAIFAREIADKDIDPYAYFLEQSSRTRYRERLAERGMTAQGQPDRGHAFRLSRHTLMRQGTDSYVIVRKDPGSSLVDDRVFFTSIVPADIDFPGSSMLSPMPRPGASSLETFAQQAYARVAPSAKVFDAAQFLGELREGLPTIIPSVVKSGAKLYKGLGSDYLNVEFGWKPFINDLIKAGQALAGATELLSGSGTRVHRRYGTPPLLQSWTKENKTGDPTIQASTLLASRGVINALPGSERAELVSATNTVEAVTGGLIARYYALRTVETTQWFEGEFTNFFRLGFDPSNYFDRLNELVNVKLTPAVLWELAPWSWLVDWFLRIGDTIKANELAANDLLVMHYGYAMRKTIQRDVLSLRLNNATPSPLPTTGTYNYILFDKGRDVSFVSVTEHKERIRANPYGFRTGGTSSLSQGQLSILGALGLTRLK